MSGCGYSLGRIVCSVLALFFIPFGVSYLFNGVMEEGVALLLIGCLALLPLQWLVPDRKPPEGMPPRLNLSGRVRELALDPQRRSEAVQAYRAETGVSDREAERAIADLLNGPTRR
jgi:hypothetical protein